MSGRARHTARGNRRRGTHRMVRAATLSVLLGLSTLTIPSVSAQPAPEKSQAEDQNQDQPHQFVTRPDLRPPRITVRTPAQGTAPGSVFLSPKTDTLSLEPALPQGGPEIVDDQGQPVWFGKRGDGMLIRTAALQPQTYQGKPVLTWWEGLPVQVDELGNPVFGNWVVMDQSYRVIARVRPGKGLPFSDMHDMKITPQNTALILVYKQTLRKIGNVIQPVIDNVIQEIDIKSGRVLMNWSSLDHIGIPESYFPRKNLVPYHYLHLNSLTLDDDGNILVSGRHTSTVYKIDRHTGKVLWRLGGKKSDFTLGKGAAFAWQHDVSRERDGTLSMFDNTAITTGKEGGEKRSRGLVLDVDEQKKTATLKHEYLSPDGLQSGTQGSMQVLPNGNAFVGWGTHGYFTEFSPKGQVRFNASFAKDRVNSYRAFRFPWRGKPEDRPAVAGRGEGGGTTAYASWNGATDVASWRFLAGPSPTALKEVKEVPKKGFETSAGLGRNEAYVAVQALDAKGGVLRTSAPAAVR
ncbi:arylsulfotransferase family protein [Streptomyces sp. ODS28]|uniref:arylsulfotransferase family protein n=1 Tax=Streptomyces sp. ODS28 TaxID=3136688 RepID=UPI0031EAD332